MVRGRQRNKNLITIWGLSGLNASSASMNGLSARNIERHFTAFGAGKEKQDRNITNPHAKPQRVYIGFNAAITEQENKYNNWLHEKND
jgi:hypothetical protein